MIYRKETTMTTHPKVTKLFEKIEKWKKGRLFSRFYRF